MWWEIALDLLPVMFQAVLIGIAGIAVMVVLLLPIVWISRYVKNDWLEPVLMVVYLFVLVWFGITTVTWLTS